MIPVTLPRGSPAPKPCPACGRALQPTALSPSTELWCALCCITCDLNGSVIVPPEAPPVVLPVDPNPTAVVAPALPMPPASPTPKPGDRPRVNGRFVKTPPAAPQSNGQLSQPRSVHLRIGAATIQVTLPFTFRVGDTDLELL